MQPLLNRLRTVFHRMLQGAFPDNSHAPTKSAKHLLMTPVAIDISLKFLPPELFIGPGSGCVAAAFMSVPKTTMDEYHCPVFREDKVGGARQLPYMKSISKSSGEKKGAKRLLRPCILSTNTRHHAAALRSGRDAHGLGGVHALMSSETAGALICQAIRAAECGARGDVGQLSMRLIRGKSRGEY